MLLSLVFLAAATYASLVPFQYEAVEWAVAMRLFIGSVFRSLRPVSPPDFAANLLFFVPMGYCIAGAILLDRSGRTAGILGVLATLGLCAVFSVLLEFCQCWFPLRCPTSSDILAQLLGAVGGVVLWWACGQWFTDAIRSQVLRARPMDRIDWLLQIYFVGFLCFSLFPFDVTVRPRLLLEKYHAGRISLMPFSGADSTVDALLAGLLGTALLVPVGVFVATWSAPATRPTRALIHSVLLGGIVIMAVNCARAFVWSRSADVADAVTGLIGVTAGIWLAHKWRGGRIMSWAPVDRSLRHFLCWMTVTGAYALFLTIVFCVPFEIADDPETLRSRYYGFFHLPFAVYFDVSMIHALSQVMKKTLLFAPLGILLTVAIVPLPVPAAVRRTLLASGLVGAALVAVSIEMIQVFLLPHVPNVTDAILCSFGAAIGALIGSTVLATRREMQAHSQDTGCAATGGSSERT